MTIFQILTTAFLNTLSDYPHTWRRSRVTETHTNSAMFQMGIISFEEQERARKAFRMSFQGTELKELNSRNPIKVKFSSQKHIKGLFSSTSLRVGHPGPDHPDHHKKPKPSCCREAMTAIKVPEQQCRGFSIPPSSLYCIFLKNYQAASTTHHWSGRGEQKHVYSSARLLLHI